MRYNSNFKYDLKVGMVAEKILAELLENKTIEVKKDLQAIKTGSIYIEYESRKKPSGLATTQADFYCYFNTDRRTKRTLQKVCPNIQRYKRWGFKYKQRNIITLNRFN